MTSALRRHTVAYRARPVRFLELWQVEDWRVKVYGIAAEGERPR
jgi:hypothetical protein